MFKKVGGGFFFMAALIALCIWAVDPSAPRERIQFGIDLQGGTELLYEVKPKAGALTGRPAEDVKAVLELRLDTYGLKELSLSVVGRDQVLIEVPGAGDSVTSIKKVIEQAGELSFHIVSESRYQTEQYITQYKAEWAEYVEKFEAYRADLESRGIEVGSTEAQDFPPPEQPQRRVGQVYSKNEDTGEYVRNEEGDLILVGERVLENTPATSVSGSDLSEAYPQRDETGANAIGFEFTSGGSGRFANMTGEHIGRMMAIVLDGQVMQEATVEDEIAQRGILRGSYTEAEIRQVVTILKGGSLPATLELENEQSIGSVLGAESVTNGAYAMVAGLALVIVFMAIYYLALGCVADLSLMINILLIWTFVVVFRNTLTFPGLAGLLLTVGMSVDANILIFERIREERARGRSLNQAVTGGYQRAFSTIFDSNLTTLITAYVLFNFGTGPVKGFAVVLSIGIVCSFFTSLYVSRLILSILMRLNLVKELRMLQLFKKTDINFLAVRRFCATLSAFVIITGVVGLGMRGSDAMGLDFTGGSRLQLNLNTPQSEGAIRERLDDMRDSDGKALFEDLQVQALGEKIQDGKFPAYSMRTRVTNDAVGEGALKTQVAGALEGLLAPEGMTRFESLDGKRLGVNLRIRKVNSIGKSNIDALLLGAQERFTSASVQELTDEPGLGTSFAAYRVEFDPPADFDLTNVQQVEQLRKDLRDVITAEPDLELATPFASVIQVGPKVASNLQGKVFLALMIAFAAIIFYVSLRFQFKFGVAAVIALIHDVMITLSALVFGDLLLGGFLELKINLPVVAALLTVVGYSLNDTIVIFDRVRENLVDTKRDVDYIKIVNLSINQTLSRTILTAVTTFFVTAILLVFGGPPLHGFAFALTIGVVVGTYSTMYIATPALIYFNDRQEARRQRLLAEAAEKPGRKKQLQENR